MHKKREELNILSFEIIKNKNDDGVYNLLTEIIGKVRQEKSLAKKSVNSPIVLFLKKNEKEKLNEVIDDLKSVTNAEIKEGEFKVEFK